MVDYQLLLPDFFSIAYVWLDRGILLFLPLFSNPLLFLKQRLGFLNILKYYSCKILTVSNSLF